MVLKKLCTYGTDTVCFVDLCDFSDTHRTQRNKKYKKLKF